MIGGGPETPVVRRSLGRTGGRASIEAVADGESASERRRPPGGHSPGPGEAGFSERAPGSLRQRIGSMRRPLRAGEEGAGMMRRVALTAIVVGIIMAIAGVVTWVVVSSPLADQKITV